MLAHVLGAAMGNAKTPTHGPLLATIWMHARLFIKFSLLAAIGMFRVVASLMGDAEIADRDGVLTTERVFAFASELQHQQDCLLFRPP